MKHNKKHNILRFTVSTIMIIKAYIRNTQHNIKHNILTFTMSTIMVTTTGTLIIISSIVTYSVI